MNEIIMTEYFKGHWAYEAWKENGYAVETIFKKKNKFFRGIRRLWTKYHLPFVQLWYGDWKDRIKEADLIVFHVSYLTMDLAKYLNKINPNAKVIAWYWNAVNEKMLPDHINGNCEKWSFDPENCKKYGMNFNHQYYFKTYIEESEKIDFDLYFCGSDVWRGSMIMEVYYACKTQEIHSKFQVVFPKSDIIPEEIKSPWIEYKEICRNIARSKAILEIVREGQSGATIRLMEALFFGKKLVTNNDLVKKEEFYNKENIFLLGDRPLEELKEFLNGKFVPYAPELLNKYDVKQWMQNFRKKETKNII